MSEVLVKICYTLLMVMTLPSFKKLKASNELINTFATFPFFFWFLK